VFLPLLTQTAGGAFARSEAPCRLPLRLYELPTARRGADDRADGARLAAARFLGRGRGVALSGDDPQLPRLAS